MKMKMINDINKYKYLLILSCFFLWGSLYSQDTIRVLAIGNSFSTDAVEQNLHEIGKSSNIVFVIGNLYIGGASLERHWTNATANTAAYSYRKINEKGEKTTTDRSTMLRGIHDEKWDYISFQQNSGNSGLLETYFPYLENLLNYVKKNNLNSKTKYVLHQTWAYATNSTHVDFANYDNDQETMYNGIMNAVYKAAERVSIDFVIPVGTAIQNGRTSFVGDNFCRDGYHLNDLGRYTSACTWFEKLSGISVIDNNFIASGITVTEGKVAQLAAHNAIANPTEIIPITISPPPSTYRISADGLTLIEWLGNEITVDMIKDNALKNVKTIANKAFYHSSRKRPTRVIIGNNVQNIDRQAFFYARGLKDIVASDNNNYFKTIDGVLYSKDGKLLHTFPYAKSTEAHDLLSGVEVIGSNAFRNITPLTFVKLPESVTTIEDAAFANNTGLRRVEFGSNVKLINNSFYSSAYITEIICKALTPPETTGTRPFGHVDETINANFFDNCILYVPEESIELYSKTITGGVWWTKFKNIRPYINSGLSHVENQNDIYKIENVQNNIKIKNLTELNLLIRVYSINGQICQTLLIRKNESVNLYPLSKGIYFIHSDKYVEKILIY